MCVCVCVCVCEDPVTQMALSFLLPCNVATQPPSPTHTNVISPRTACSGRLLWTPALDARPGRLRAAALCSVLRPDRLSRHLCLYMFRVGVCVCV